jgi:erythromycin esterase
MGARAWLAGLVLGIAGPAGPQEAPQAPAPEVTGEPGAPVDEQAEAVRTWVAGRSVPLESTAADATTPGADLAAISSALGGVRVVGLGEANHGTAEFFSFRHRLLRQLVREGFRVVAFESHHSGSAVVDDYIHGGASSLEEAMAALGMRVWQVEELAALLRWLREHNQGSPPAERVRFVGIDMQGLDQPSAAIQDYLARVDPALFEAGTAFYADLCAAAARAWAGEAEALGDRGAALEARLADFVLKRGRYVARSSVAEYGRILEEFCIAAQFTRTFGGGAIDARDRAMADNVLAILADEPTAKIALLAHNAHVQRGELSFAPPGHFAAGEYLARDLGGAYYALGLVLGQGTFQALEQDAQGAWQFAVYEVGPPPPSTAEWLFANAGLGDAFLDLRAGPRPAAVQAWLDQPRGLRWAGGYAVPANIGERWRVAGNVPRSRIPLEFDGLVYVAQVRRASPLP